MDTDPGILCFHHCQSMIFCFKLPERCPVCDKIICNEEFQVLPFRIPYPFVRASQHPCSIVIKPTIGDFLNDYLNSKDLHIAVTSSSGSVVEFDKGGLQFHQTELWKQCLVICGASGPWLDHWDTVLKQITEQDCWSARRYNEDNFNCYTFVLTFLEKIKYENLSKFACDRTKFCENYIVPKTTAASKFISLYRKLCRSGFLVQNISHSQQLGPFYT